MAYIYRDGKRIDFDSTPLIRPPDIIHYARRPMPDATPTQKYRLTVQYPPSETKTGGAYIKDSDGVLNFGDSSLLTLQQRDVIDVERTYNAPKGKFNASFTIHSWKPVASAEQQPAKPFLRPRTDPKDQRQIWVTALMKEWMAAYAQSCDHHTGEEMAPMTPVCCKPWKPHHRYAAVRPASLVRVRAPDTGAVLTKSQSGPDDFHFRG